MTSHVDPTLLRLLPEHKCTMQIPGWSLEYANQAVGRIFRPNPVIVKHGRFYTKSSITEPVPRNLLFRTRRGAKKFFAVRRPVVIFLKVPI